MKKHIATLSVSILFFLMILSQTALSEVTFDEDITIVEKSSNRLILEIAIDSVKIQPIDINGQTVFAISISDLGHTAEPGRVRLPIGSTTLGIPPTAEVDLNILDVDYTEMPISNIEMVSTLDYENYLKSEHVYQQPKQQAIGWYPENFAKLDIIGFIREQRVAKIIYYPVLYNYSTKQAKMAKKYA